MNNNEELKLYDVSWGLDIVRHVRIRAENAVDAASRIRQRYGWHRAGNYTVDAQTRGDLCCEMLVDRSNGRCTMLVATLV